MPTKGDESSVIVIHGNSLEHVTDAYKRFLEGRFRKEFDLVGTPLRIEMKTSHNPSPTAIIPDACYALRFAMATGGDAVASRRLLW